MDVESMQGRNELCSCGSGKRFKHCCGAAEGGPDPSARAVAAYHAGRLNEAERYCREMLQSNPNSLDARHLLGVVLLQRGCCIEALEELLVAGRATNWMQPELRSNLGLAIAKLLASGAREQLERLCAVAATGAPAAPVSGRADTPLVSVVLPSYNHARYVADAIASVANQSYGNLELIVIDDGSTDASAVTIERALAHFPFASRFITRENRGASATLNQGASMARGEFLGFLNSDDLYVHERVERLVDAVSKGGGEWGFSGVEFIDRDGLFSEAVRARAEDHRRWTSTLRERFPSALALVRYNLAYSSGNLFVHRSLFERLGGFRDYRYNHDWDFCLRATCESDPVVVQEALYRYRYHGANTIAEEHDRILLEADKALGSVFRQMCAADRAPCPNPRSPWAPDNGVVFLELALAGGMGRVFEGQFLGRLAEDLLRAAASATGRGPPANAAPEST